MEYGGFKLPPIGNQPDTVGMESLSRDAARFWRLTSMPACIILPVFGAGIIGFAPAGFTWHGGYQRR